ncbi:MAG: hypothetical protein ACE5H7_10415, partial [Acidiferrobacterales bacterium]
VNVKDYQDALIAKIQTGTLTAADLRTQAELVTTTLAGNDPAADGTTIPGALRISLEDTALAQGSLIPTNTGCVRSATNHVTNGRWRNGALTLHLIAVGPAELGSLSAWVNIQPDDPDTPAVEPTGVTVSDPARFLYESTMFWHWVDSIGEVREQIGTGTKLSLPCYGDPGWAAAKDALKNVAPLTQAEIDAVNQLIADLNAVGDTTGANDLADLLAEALGAGSPFAGGGSQGGSGGSAPVEVLPAGGVQSTGETPGVTINTGPRSWVEIGNF